MAEQEMEYIEETGQEAPMQTPGDSPEEEKIDPKLEREMQGYVNLLMKGVHSQETRGAVKELLQVGKPQEAIPNAAITILKGVDDRVSQRKDFPMEAKFAGLVYVVSDLMEISNAMGLSQFTEKDMQPILTETIQTLVAEGLADGSIDPIELQAMTEEIMPPEVRELGMQFANELGLPEQPDERMAYEQLIDKKTRPLKEENENLKKQMAGHKQQMAQAQQAQQQGQGGALNIGALFGGGQ
ncbi:MAG: hypothetical protein WC961_07735 [Anaerovoracaceae bacterium]